jgi:hypothetical protein
MKSPGYGDYVYFNDKARETAMQIIEKINL